MRATRNFTSTEECLKVKRFREKLKCGLIDFFNVIHLRMQNNHPLPTLCIQISCMCMSYALVNVKYKENKITGEWQVLPDFGKVKEYLEKSVILNSSPSVT